RTRHSSTGSPGRQGASVGSWRSPFFGYRRSSREVFVSQNSLWFSIIATTIKVGKRFQRPHRRRVSGGGASLCSLRKLWDAVREFKTAPPRNYSIARAGNEVQRPAGYCLSTGVAGKPVGLSIFGNVPSPFAA